VATVSQQVSGKAPTISRSTWQNKLQIAAVGKRLLEALPDLNVGNKGSIATKATVSNGLHESIRTSDLRPCTHPDTQMILWLSSRPANE